MQIVLKFVPYYETYISAELPRIPRQDLLASLEFRAQDLRANLEITGVFIWKIKIPSRWQAGSLRPWSF